MTRDVRDAALMLREMARPDPRDWFSLPWQDVDYAADLASGIAGWRIAYSPSLGFAKVDAAVAADVRRAVQVLADLGAIVEEVDPPITADCTDIFHTHWFVGAYNALLDLPAADFAKLDPGLLKTYEMGKAISMSEYLRAVNARGKLGVAMRNFHQAYDLLVTPSLAVPAFEAGRLAPADMGDAYWTAWTPFTYPFNLTQQPALSVPCGFTADGLPIGLQIVGPMHRDDRVLRAGAAYQSATDWHRRRPEMAA